jgi:thermitase
MRMTLHGLGGAAARRRRPRLARSGALALVPALMLVAALTLAPASGAISKTRSVDRPRAKYVPGQLLVRFRPQAGAAAIANLEASLGARTIRVFPFVSGLTLIRLSPGASVIAGASSFGASSDVRYAQPNWVSHINVDTRTDRTPNDPLYNKQWDWPKINAPAAWDLTIGNKRVVVGDIDTGIDYTHPDLKANVWNNVPECSGTPGVDDDHNGYIDDCHGIDTINGDSDPMDDFDHGTHTGGTIGAVGNNGVGVTGINWRVTVLPCKSHDASGNGSIASIIECYQYMVTEKTAGYDIIATNNSYGGCPEACGFDSATKDGIAALGKAGILFAVAAVNNSSNNDTTPVYPANYFLPNVIAVAATTSKDGLAGFSDYGVRSVMVGAPGSAVESTIIGGYASFSGTSMATPHIAGLAALIHAYDPSLNIYQIRNLIIAGGNDIASLAGRTVSGKRIDALGSLTCSNSKVFGMLRPLDSAKAGKTTVAALNVDCAQGAGALTVKVKPGNITLSLADKGKHGDLRAHDGIYSANWNATPGSYTLTFSNGKSYTVNVS